ncbi:MAG: NTP transferase domain-containing protein [Candidatus Lokiarchaeota archaeon]|nr:NTP transferase domain-containing protein [Candidatus Lokiarchaeota archaeon]MBD3340661.1 NTP transferase domain-containing protein [Candidatus Lokiarchaeota archaeon]
MTRKWSAIILAGGKGTRLMPLTAELPKPLVKVTNKPMVDYAIAHLIYADIKHIILALAYMGEKLKEYIEKTWTKDELGDVELECVVQESVGTADAYRLLTDHLDSENVVVSMADIVTNLPMRDFMSFHTKKGGIATISMKTVESHTSQYGVVLLDKERKIYLFLEKPGPMELYLSSMTQKAELFLHTNIINTGIYCFQDKVEKILHETNLMDFGGELFPYLLENKYDLYGFVRDYYWLDCGNPETYLWANWDLLRKYAWPITPNGEEYDEVYVMGIIDSGRDVKIEKPTAFGEHVKLHNNVRIKELSVIGSNVSIGQDTIIERSVIWENVKVGAGCKIIDSIICNSCEIGDNVVLKKAIIAPYCKVSSEQVIQDETLEMGQKVE